MFWSSLARRCMSNSVRGYTTSNFDQVLHSKSGRSAVLNLNRPKVLNSLNLDMVRFLTPLYKELNSDPNVSNIVLKGVGKAFCAGGDIVQIYESGIAAKKSKVQDYPLHTAFFREEYNLNYLIGTLATPHIAILNGIFMGGGVGLSVHGHFRVATENALFAMPETGIGFFPDVGGTYFLPRLQGAYGNFLALTGHRVKGAEVVALGIATHFVKSDVIENLEKALSELSTKDVNKVGEVLKQFSSPLPSFETSEIFAEEKLIHRVFSLPSVEEIFDALSKEKSSFATKTLETLNKMSPTSLKVSHKQMLLGKKLDFGNCFDLEFKLCQSFMADSDFFEGVRALLVDKTKDPKWNPARLGEVSNESVQKYFDFPVTLKLPIPKL